jgi:hypothetical protein
LWYGLGGLIRQQGLAASRNEVLKSHVASRDSIWKNGRCSVVRTNASDERNTKVRDDWVALDTT